MAAQPAPIVWHLEKRRALLHLIVRTENVLKHEKMKKKTLIVYTNSTVIFG